MSDQNNVKKQKRARRRKHIRQIVQGTSNRPRMVVFRSNKHIYAQLVDDLTHQTITGTSTLCVDIRDEIKKGPSKLEKAKIVGKHIAHLAKQKNIETVVFDRAGYLYHGRVKALADGAREGGLKF
jgi:large subunit ribosomal protein L18